MRKFLKNSALFLALPLLFIVLYVLSDPFRLFGELSEQRAHYVAGSDDFYGVERYLANKKSGQDYNTFLFGNSKVMAYQESFMCRAMDSCSFYNFGAPGESLLNILMKIKLIQEQGDRIARAVLVLDHKVLMNERNTHPSFQGPVYEHHPRVSDNTWLSFHSKFLQYFVKDAFFISYFTHRLCDCYLPFMEEHFNQPENLVQQDYEPKNNQVNNAQKKKYRREHFSKKLTAVKFPVLSEAQIEILQSIKERLEQERSEIQIIFGPLLSSDKLPDEIEASFTEIFGADQITNLCDKHFGENDWWYDESHYGNETIDSNQIL